ncbi:MAG: hypothetical protein JWN35_2735 [Frankiales bacterium]|jgi:hypothetical protein|nr:hypothetical protein [Frankiales bacterium]
MLLALAGLLAAVLVGLLRGGDLSRLGQLHLRSRRMVWAALATQFAGGIVGGPVYVVGLVLSAALVAVFLSGNRGIRGTGLVALGLVANALVVGLNGAMPVSVTAAARAGVSTLDVLSGADPRHEIAGDSTRLPWLGDVIAVPAPVRAEVVSPGDVLVAAGLAQLVVLGMGSRGRSQGRHGEGRLSRRTPGMPNGPQA